MTEFQLSLFDKKIIKNLPPEKQKLIFNDWVAWCGEKSLETSFNDFLYFWGNSTETYYKQRRKLV